jgi:hypothetical protein
MAPREATGTFPDQFLTFDYDASAGLGVQPPHEAPGGQAVPEPQTHGSADPVPSDVPGLNAQPSINSTRGSVQIISHIDPLSIDPTLNESSPWQHSVDAATPLNIPFAQTSFLDVLNPINETETLGIDTVRSILPRQVSRSPDEMNVSNSDASSPQVPSSDLFQTSFRSAFGGPNSNLPSNRSPRSNLLSYQETIGSVLDNSTSIESDDEDDEELPGLDRTFDSAASSIQKFNQAIDIVSDEEAGSETSSCSASYHSIASLGMINHNSAFDMANDHPQTPQPLCPSQSKAPLSPNSIMLSFGPNTSVSDLKYFAERGCIVALLQALTTPRLITLGTRMLADYAKMSDRRVAVASNRRILEFILTTMLEISEKSDLLGREYAVETVRSLTATEESDRFLMSTPGLLNALALVARGGPFLTKIQEGTGKIIVPLASEKARLHACIAIMNLSCGKANKIEIAKVHSVLEAMRDVMVSNHEEARLKATTCIKNLSNADANDSALLGTPGLVEALGHVAAITCSPELGSTTCTTNACLALMNLSISKGNKHRVFRTPGVMESLMIVLDRTTSQGSNNEARIKACSALSNLAIGYDNKIPMFSYPGFVDAILNVIQTDTGEARTKACSILWSFAAEMKNQVPVSIVEVKGSYFSCYNLPNFWFSGRTKRRHPSCSCAGC